MTLRTLNYGSYGIFLIMGNAGFCPSTILLPFFHSLLTKGRVLSLRDELVEFRVALSSLGYGTREREMNERERERERERQRERERGRGRGTERETRDPM